MGIINFLQWIRSKSVGGVGRFVPEEGLESIGMTAEVDNLYIDTNSIVYNEVNDNYPHLDTGILRNMTSRLVHPNIKELDEQLPERIWNEIVRVIGFVRPKKEVYIFFDGCPPMAKIKNQKESRYMYGSAQSQYFDKANISPGTKFMVTLTKYILAKLEDPENSYLLPPTINISTHLVSGEGEHKIFDVLRMTDDQGNYIVHPDDHNVIYGNDSDLVILSLLSEHRLFVFRETIQPEEKLKNNKEYYTDSNPQVAYKYKRYYDTEFIDIRYVRERISYLLTGEEYDESNIKRVMAGFAFISFFGGNDFIPISPEIGDIKYNMDRLCELYRLSAYDRSYTGTGGQKGPIKTRAKPVAKPAVKFDHIINQDGTLNIDRMISFFERVLINEKNPKTSMRMDLGKRAGSNGLYQGGNFRNKWYTMALRQRGGGMTVDPELLINPLIIAHMALSYLSIIGWNLRYYLYGMSEINPEFFYVHNFAPLIYDLWSMACLVRDDRAKLFPINYKAMRYGPFQQLLMILPFKSDILKPTPPKKTVSEEDRKYYIRNINKFYAMGSAMRPYMPVRFIFENDLTETSPIEKETDYDSVVLNGVHRGEIQSTVRRRKHIFLPPPNLEVTLRFTTNRNINKNELMKNHVSYAIQYNKDEDEGIPRRYSERFTFRGNNRKKRQIQVPDIVPKETTNKSTAKLDEVRRILGATIQSYREATMAGQFPSNRNPRRMLYTDEIFTI